MVYENKRGDFIIPNDDNPDFYVQIEGADGTDFTREELTELRAIIDQALNTSAEELEAPGE